MANLSGCLKCIKYSLFVFNFIFWAIGCALIGVGIWVLVDAKRVLDIYNSEVDESIRQEVGVLSEDVVKTAGIAVIVIGGVVMITGFLGCCGAIRESQALLAMFFGILFIIFAALIAIGIVAIVKKDWIKDSLARIMEKESTSNYAKSLLAYGYSTYGCCGIYDEPTCSKNYPPYDVTPNPCLQGSTECSKGCLNVYWSTMSNMAIGAGVAALVAGGVVIFGLVFSMCLCCAIRQK